MKTLLIIVLAIAVLAIVIGAVMASKRRHVEKLRAKAEDHRGEARERRSKRGG